MRLLYMYFRTPTGVLQHNKLAFQAISTGGAGRAAHLTELLLLMLDGSSPGF